MFYHIGVIVYLITVIAQVIHAEENGSMESENGNKLRNSKGKEHTLTHVNIATPRVFSSKTQDFTPVSEESCWSTKISAKKLDSYRK